MMAFEAAKRRGTEKLSSIDKEIGRTSCSDFCCLRFVFKYLGLKLMTVEGQR